MERLSRERTPKKGEPLVGRLAMARNLEGLRVGGACVLLLISSSLMLSTCNKSSGGSSAPTPVNPPVPAITQTADAGAGNTAPALAAAGQPALPSDPMAIYTLLDGAVTTIFSAHDGHEAPSFSPFQLALAPAMQLTASAECTDSATPKNVLSGVPFPPVHKDFAAGRLYCLINANSYATSSIQGAYYQNRGILCLINKVLKGSFSGKPLTVAVDFADEDCFNDEFRTLYYAEGLPPPATAQVTAQRPSALSPDKWDSSIVITLPPEWAGGGTLTLLFATKPTRVAAAALFDQGAERKESYSLSLEPASGILRADVRSYHWNDGDRERNEHFRIYAQGSMGNDGKFTKLSHVEGVDALAFNMDPDKEIRLHALRMDFSQGGRASQRYCATASGCADVFDITKYSASMASGVCYAGDGGADSCTGVAPMAFNANGDIDFALIPGGSHLQPSDALIKSGALGFSSVTTVDLQP